MSKVQSVVRLTKKHGSKKQLVEVGISVGLGVPPERQAYFRWSKAGSRMVLRQAGWLKRRRKRMDLFVDAMIAVVAGAEAVRRECPRNFDYEFTLLRGLGLFGDFNQGFCQAAYMAASAASGFRPAGFQDCLSAWGWSDKRAGH